MTEEVITKDHSSGKIHRRVLMEHGGLASLEADNLDSAGSFEVIEPDALDTAKAGDLCLRCFPDDKQDGQAE